MAGTARINTENILKVIGVDRTFLNSTPVTQEIDPRVDEWYQKKLIFFFTANGTISRVNMQPTEWEETDASYTSKD